MEKLKLIAIKTKKKIYISDNINNDSSRYHYSKIKDLFFDGELPAITYRNDWFEIKQIPSSIKRKKPQRRVNERYELKEGFTETELTPKIINKSSIWEDDEYYSVKGLYDFKYELVDEGYEEIPFEINVIEENNNGNFEIIKPKYQLKHGILDQIQVPQILLTNKPCYLSKEESYKIIRDFVKLNIDLKYARITSDYDFCFTVKKIISHFPESYTVNINSFNKRKKPKYETNYRRSREVTIYEVAPKPYNSYPVVEEFYGKDYEDLEKNINLFLENLIEKINKPLVECEHCKGLGVVLDEN